MRDTLGLLGIVRNPQNSETRPYSSSDQRLDRRYGSGIGGRGRLIEQQHLWSHHQRADKREPQPLACRQAADRPSLRLLGKPQVFDKGACRRPFVEVFADRICPPARLRRHIPDQAAPFGSGDRRAVAAVQAHQTFVGIKVCDGSQQQCFAGPGRAAYGDAFTYRQRERGSFDEVRSKIANLKDRRAGVTSGENRFVSLHRCRRVDSHLLQPPVQNWRPEPDNWYLSPRLACRLRQGGNLKFRRMETQSISPFIITASAGGLLRRERGPGVAPSWAPHPQCSVWIHSFRSIDRLGGGGEMRRVFGLVSLARPRVSKVFAM